MRLPLSLIKSFLPLEMAPVKIGETLTLLGIEVDRIHQEQPPFANVVVGEILSTAPHPQDNHLQIATVSDGTKTHSVVCGAPNCRKGMKTAFARMGAVLSDANAEQRQIEKIMIRGIVSEGMLCSASELHLWEDKDGILDLPRSMNTGEDLIQLLWDPVFEISLTPNLGHCMSALGIARELSAALQIPLFPRQKKKSPTTALDKQILVRDGRLCPHYMCYLIENVQVGPSPFWLQRQLEASGQKSINCVVDAANYAMIKMGQPLHAFDFDLLAGNTLEIGPSTKVQKFLGLDGVEREIPAGVLLISDSRNPVAIAGIIGGANSAVSGKTTRVLLEAAYFDSAAIRSASKKIALRSESSQRFEKGIDPMGLEAALSEAWSLMGGNCKAVAEVKKGTIAPKTISFRLERINQILGTKLSATEVEQIFQRLGFKTANTSVEAPPYRHDLSEEIDLVEEVARIYGYNNIEKTTPLCTTSQIPHDPVFLFEQQVRSSLCSLGLCESLSCDLISPKLSDIAREITSSSMECLRATTCKSEEYSILRTSLLPGLLQIVKTNFAQKNQTLSFFEIGRIHFLQQGKAVEIPMAALLLTGKRTLPHWSHKSPDVDFFDLKGVMENLLSKEQQPKFHPSHHTAFHPGRQADIHIGEWVLGSLGEIHPHLLAKFDLDQRIYYAEINLSHLLKFKKTHLQIHPLPQFPSSERDWTIPLNLKTAMERVFQAIHSVKAPLLEQVELIDLYHPKDAAQKNATLRFTYRDPFKTISFEEVEKEHAKVMEQVLKKLAQ